jgi:hypothetical protein
MATDDVMDEILGACLLVVADIPSEVITSSLINSLNKKAVIKIILI